MQGVFAISDIHGYCDALKEALEHVDLSGDNQLVLLGDYIDYGPQSGGTLRYIHELQQRYGSEKVLALRGNHEEAFLEWLDTYSSPRAGEPDEFGMVPWNDWLDHDVDFAVFRTLVSPEQWEFFCKVMPTLSEDSRNTEAARMVAGCNRELISWLRRLPYFYETDRQIFVHAGIDEEADDWWPWATPEHTFVGKFPAVTGSFLKDIIAGHVGTSALAGDEDYHGVFWDGESHYYIDGSIQRGGQLNILSWDDKRGYRQWDGGWKQIRGRRSGYAGA